MASSNLPGPHHDIASLEKLAYCFPPRIKGLSLQHLLSGLAGS